jgi:Carboxypeptidase regulatory-like domain/TonB-dependent Receptor Plug Domain
MLSLKRITSGVCVVVVMSAMISPVIAQQPRGTTVLRVTTNDESGAPVVGASAQLKSRGTIVGTTTTNDKGEAEFANVTSGTYDVVVSKDGFEPLTQADVVVGDQTQEIKFTMVPKITLKEGVTVQAGQDAPLERGSSPSSELQRTTLKDTANKPATVSDALPLVPGFVRSADGEIKISGTGEHRSAFIVNSADVTDPATGQFGMTVPVDSVESISVFKTPYLAQFGRFTAGVVAVETRRGGDKWNYELNDPLPDFRIRSGSVRGIREATPRLTFNGPLIHDKLYFSEGFEYAIAKRPDRTLPFPFNETKKEAINSFTQLDYILSPTNTLTGTFHVAPLKMAFVNLNFFNPQPVTPTFGDHDYTGTVFDRLTVGSNLLESTVAIKKFHGRVWGEGSADMVLAPAGNSGNYFSQQDRRASRIEWLESYSLAPITLAGQHNLKFGTTVAHTNTRGEFLARPVDIDDASGQLLKRIEFVGGQPYNVSDLEFALYGQDHWVMSPRLALDIGARMERQGITDTYRVAPRAGLAWTPFGSNSTVVRGGFGIFYDRVPLSIYAFSHYPQQVVTTFGPGGVIIDGPRVYANITDQEAVGYRFPFIRSGNKIGNFAPYGVTWNVEVEHPVTKMLKVRANYLQTNSSGVVNVTPKLIDGADAFVLGGNGKSRYHQLELTARLNLKDGQQLFFSYVRSRTRGDLNEFSSYFGNFPFPVVRPDQMTNLSGDLPNRFLAWGMIRLPWKVRISPLVEYRNGFPYAVTDAMQNYVGVANSTRYPNFYSFDSRFSKDFKLSDKYTLRLSARGLNLTNHFNPLAVHSNIADPQFGAFFGNHRRRFLVDFDVIF